MSLCALCGLTAMRSLETNDTLCDHHSAYFVDDWATANRIVCDLLHRGIAPKRLTPEERADEFWANSDTTG